MSTTIPQTSVFRDALDRVTADVVSPAASGVDAAGTFPRENIEALGAAGLLGLMSAAEVGGPGLGLTACSASWSPKRWPPRLRWR